MRRSNRSIVHIEMIDRNLRAAALARTVAVAVVAIGPFELLTAAEWAGLGVFRVLVYTPPALAPQSSKFITVGLSKYPVCAVVGSENNSGTLNSPFDR